MNAVEFVKKHGISRTKYWIEEFTKINKLPEEMINIEFLSDLKRLVESYELVMEHGSIERAKKYADSPYTAPEIKDVLLKAIIDAEGCL